MQAGAGLYFDGNTVRPITCEDRLGSYHYVKEGRGADAPNTASVVVQTRYTQSDRETGEPDLNASASGKSEEMSENRKRSSIWLHFNDIGDCKADCRIYKMKISVRAGSTTKSIYLKCHNVKTLAFIYLICLLWLLWFCVQLFI